MIKHLSNVQELNKSHYKIFCDFHERDSEHFLKVKDDLFNLCKCSLFYCENGEKGFNEASEGMDFSEFNLFVLIVSSNVLFDPDFDRGTFDKAAKANIPILPIAVENGLETYFNEKFGNIQCINTCLEFVDPTAVPYAEKLQNFLAKALHLSLDIDKLRGAFDASIFLSYRKKDRKYAQRLLEVIHSSDELKNVAVWYDEFLVPGEDFNEGIKAELENSAVFVLMVTPSILEEKNYIKIVEYPIAQTLNKTVLPVEAVPTNASRLNCEYPDLPQTISVLETERLKNSIIEVLEKNGITICKRTAERDFFIGFAFLKGMYVEKNTLIATEMITRAAEAGVTEAISALVSLYKYGDGCEINTENAVKWQGEYVKKAKAIFNEAPTEENADNVISAYKELADIFLRAQNTVSAADAFTEAVDFLKASPLNGGLFAKLRRAEAYESAGRLFMDEGDYAKARYGYLEKAIDLRNEIYSSAQSKEAAVDLIGAYLLLAQCQSECDDMIGLKTTVKVKLKELGARLLEYGVSDVKTEEPKLLQKVLFGLNGMGMYSNQLKMQEQAFIYIGGAVELAEEMNNRYNNLSTSILAYKAFVADGEQHVNINVENHLIKAEFAFSRAYELALDMLSKGRTAETELAFAQSSLNLARIKHKLKKADAADTYLEEALRLYGEVLERVNTIPVRQSVYKSYYIAAEIYNDTLREEKACLLLNKGLEINEEIAEKTSLSVYKLEMAEALKQKGEALKKQWEFDEALECFKKRHELIKAGAHKNIHILLIAESYKTLISTHKSVGNFQEASELEKELIAFKHKYELVFSGKVTFYS